MRGIDPAHHISAALCAADSFLFLESHGDSF